MTELFFADTNFFLRLLLNDIASQVKLVEKHLKEAKEGKIKIIVCSIVIFELIFILEKTMRVGKKKALQLVRDIVKIPYLDIEERTIFLEALDLYERTNIDFVDIFLYIRAKNDGAKILSFDRDFKKLKDKRA